MRRLHDDQALAIAQLRGTCAELAVDIVRKIAGNIDSARWLLAQAQQAAEQVHDEPTIKLRVHSSQLESVQALLNQAEQSRIHSVIADESVLEQTCLLDTGHGQIDIALETQLEAVLAVLGDSQGHN